MQRDKRQAGRLDLAELHAICEANYARLLRLFPDYERSNIREFAAGEARIALEVLDRSRYTTSIRLHQQQAEPRWLGHLRVEVRAYHDVGMLEVTAFQSHRRIQPRYRYPNHRMYQRDEKSQQNRFLADWLEHCLRNGRAPIGIDGPAVDA